MISLNELKRIAAKQKVALGVVEKDYALTWVLYGLSTIESKQYFVFKGGTALQKTFLDYSRLSEDIDFTLEKPLNEVKSEINQLKNEVESRTNQLRVSIDQLNQRIDTVIQLLVNIKQDQK